MKKSVFLCIVFFTIYTLLSFSQVKKPFISFEKETHNFADIKEVDGKVTYHFVLTNTGGEPLIINSVKASCGCTSPNWTREPISPGGKGFVSATYDPNKRPGVFNKSITVTSNCEQPVNILKITGNVIPKPVTIEDSYPIDMGDARLRNSHFMFRRIKNTEIRSDTAGVYNPSDKPLKLNFIDVPAYIKIRTIPDIIPPKKTGVVEVTYNATKKNDFGSFNDRIPLKINDEENASNTLFITAEISEDFSTLAPEELAKAPKIEFETQSYNFGTVKMDQMVDCEFKFTNTGKSNLIIRKTNTSCGCTVATVGSSIIAPGKTGSVKARFDTKGRKNRQTKDITVISNDPNNPSVVLKIIGTVLAPENSNPVPSNAK